MEKGLTTDWDIAGWRSKRRIEIKSAILAVDGVRNCTARCA
jgi:hypothetical protein